MVQVHLGPPSSQAQRSLGVKVVDSTESGLTAGQDVDRPPRDGIDQDGRVDVAAAQREVINTHNLRRGTAVGLGQVDDQPQQGDRG